MRTGRNKVKEEKKKRKHKHQRGTKEDCKSWKINREDKYNMGVWRPWMGELLVAKHDLCLGTRSSNSCYMNLNFICYHRILLLFSRNFWTNWTSF
jgi:hypothetical protein